MRIALAITLPMIGTLALAGCALPQQEATLLVSGAESAQISYSDGGLESGTYKLPFRETVTAAVGVPQPFLITATADETISCTIIIDDEIVSTNSGTSVTCSG